MSEKQDQPILVGFEESQTITIELRRKGTEAYASNLRTSWSAQDAFNRVIECFGEVGQPVKVLKSENVPDLEVEVSSSRRKSSLIVRLGDLEYPQDGNHTADLLAANPIFTLSIGELTWQRFKTTPHPC